MGPSLTTVEEFFELPGREDVYVELHFGRLVEIRFPKLWQVKLRHRIASLLDARCGSGWCVLMRLPFRALPQFDLRTVDVGVVAKTRADAVGDGDLFGSPEIVIDVSTADIAETPALFLSTGTQQFCIIDDRNRTVTVTGTDSKTLVYKIGDEIPFPLLGFSLPVAEIWEA